MQRSELQKEIRRYANTVNFHKYGLIRQLLKLKEKRWKYLKEEVRKKEVMCPYCNQDVMEIEYDDYEYGGDTYLYCSHCDNMLDDEIAWKYIKAYDILSCESYFDDLLNEVFFTDSKGSGYQWEMYCEGLIKKMLEKGVGDKNG